MYKGIVMEMDASGIIVMTSEGKFAKIPLEQRICQIGEEIAFTLVERKRTPWLMLGSFAAVAAVVLLLLFNVSGFNMTANKQIVAYVSIDINPSVEMGIDENNIVLEIHGLNEDGVNLIKNLKFANKTVDAMTEVLLLEAEKKYLSKGEGDIIISSTLGENANSNSKVNDVLLSSELKEVAIQHIAKLHPAQKSNYQVTAFAAPKEVRKIAQSKGLSTGKYSIYLNAKDSGRKTTIEDLKKESVHAIAKKSGGIDKLIQSETLSKEKISALLKHDESGDLDRKLIKMQNDKKIEDKKVENKKVEDKKVGDKKVEDKKNEDKKNEDKKNEDKKNEDQRKQDQKNQDQRKQDQKNQDQKNQDQKNQDQKNQDRKNNDQQNQDQKNNDQKNQDNNQDNKNEDNRGNPTLNPERTPQSTPKPITSDNNDRARNSDREKQKEQEAQKDKNINKATDPVVKIHKNQNKNESGD